MARLAQRGERFGAAYVIDILRGGQSQRLIDRGHTALSVYGIGKQHSVAYWRNIARALVHQQLLNETQDGYPVLLLNRDSWTVLRGERAFSVVELPAKVRAPDAVLPGSDQNDALFDQLRGLRKRIAQQSGVPPYVIFHDATLRAMAAARPASLKEFAQVGGVGQNKLAKYGASFIAVIRAHAATTDAT